MVQLLHVPSPLIFSNPSAIRLFPFLKSSLFPFSARRVPRLPMAHSFLPFRVLRLTNNILALTLALTPMNGHSDMGGTISPKRVFAPDARFTRTYSICYRLRMSNNADLYSSIVLRNASRLVLASAEVGFANRVALSDIVKTHRDRFPTRTARRGYLFPHTCCCW